MTETSSKTNSSSTDFALCTFLGGLVLTVMMMLAVGIYAISSTGRLGGPVASRGGAATGPVDYSGGDAVAGEQLFVANCSACHQPDGHGKPGIAPSIRNRDFLAISSDDFIAKTVHAGRVGTAMAPRPDLDTEKTSHIIAFLRALPVANPVEITVDPGRKHSGDATKGATKYAAYCASCHGSRGEGYLAGGAGPAIGLPGFLAVASDDYIFQTVKHGRMGTAMKSFMGSAGLANLEASDVGDIIAHLRRNAEQNTLAQLTAPAPSEPSATMGQTLFVANCGGCHQADGNGKPGLAPSIRNRDFLALASDQFIKTTVQKGRAGTTMVPRPDLPEPTLDHIIAYLRSVEVRNPVQISVDPTKKYHGDASAGKLKYTQFCGSCHGPRGEGY
ncbi:MAG: c-type cytochrome, partial [Phycisphaerae bacterium]|nr:c-type cytochrome [Phycisphaerae bacterium]